MFNDTKHKCSNNWLNANCHMIKISALNANVDTPLQLNTHNATHLMVQLKETYAILKNISFSSNLSSQKYLRSMNKV